MKKRTLILFVMLLSVVGVRAKDGIDFPIIPYADLELKLYGKKQTNSIDVRILGGGVARPGRYFLKEKTSAFEVIHKAGISEPKFSITRRRESAQKSEEFRFAFDTSTMDGINRAKGFLLENNDVVFVPQPIL